MVPSFLKVAAVSAVGIGGTAGTVYLGGKAVNFSEIQDESDELIDTFKDKFEGRLVTAKASDKKWQTRFKKLQEAKAKKPQESGIPEVSKAEELQKWCQDASIAAFDTSKEKVFEDYCVLINEEQASKKLIQKGNGWKDANERLSKAKDSDISEELKKVRDKVKTDLEESKELENWCTSKYSSPFKGKKDQEFIYLGTYCTEVKKPAKPAASKAPQAADPVKKD
ncbi:hypothetical protein HF1_07340 [Mycoplasma haemofelis str. Langford 1]|uniref:Uncharacterized protein n=1 Tax=Mycoplasma haemofelis (strain Langford 1) TaxID=941640 RepID=E8ZHX1_MYCHL|nr:hypothetical protein [Mycoplasma haemofelis]CBY92742.1 hypothetical protein HF1_07340 [Mycoplasma haemofelis str. Langford 1]